MKLGRQAFLNHIGFTLAPIEVTNEVLVEKYQNEFTTSILKKSGVDKRYKLPSGTLISDFATEAADNFFQKYDINKLEIDFLIFCSECPDYLGPATSCIIQKKCNLPKNIGTLDISFGCSGYTYGLAMAKALIESGLAEKVLFITADMPNAVIPANNLNLNSLFSDASSVSLISCERIGLGFQVNDFCFGTDGTGAESIISRNSAFAKSDDKLLDEEEYMKSFVRGRMEMNGEDVFRFSLREVPVLVKEILSKHHLSFEEIDLFVFHQASEIILKALKRKLNIADEKFFSNLKNFGNTVSSSIPIALLDAIKQGLVNPGMRIMLLGFGIGYSWSGTIIEN